MLDSLYQNVVKNLWPLLSILCFFGGSIFVHELGHFLAARRRGLRVLRFSIGFGPRIFGWTDRRGTEWRVSWLPLGGYVALPQLADMGTLEGGDGTEGEKLPPIGYRDKLWVAVMGAVFNILFAVALATILWQVGRPVTEDESTNRIGSLVRQMVDAEGKTVPGPAATAGLQLGDVIRQIDGRPIHNWIELREALVLGTGVADSGQRMARLEVERDGRSLEITVHPVRSGDDKFRKIGVGPAYSLIVERIEPNSAAAKAGLLAGDRLASLSGQPLFSLDHLGEQLENASSPQVDLVVERSGQAVRLVVPVPGGGPRAALAGAGFSTGFQLLRQTPWSQISQIAQMTFRTLWGLVNPRSDVHLDNVQGFIGIGRSFWYAAKSDWPFRFSIWFAVIINVSLAVFNLLPIPVLDGGQVVFATITKLRGRPLPLTLVASIQSFFIVLFLSLMLYVSFNDVKRAVRDSRPPAAKDAPQKAPAAPEPAPAPAAP